jgi:hypothetical protein
VVTLLVTALFAKISWDEKRRKLREMTGWKPWHVYGGELSPHFFDNEDAAVRYAYRWSLKLKAQEEVGSPLTQLDAVSQFWSDQSEADMPRTRSGV